MADKSRLTEGEGTRLGGILHDFTVFHHEASGRTIAGGAELEANFVLYQLCNGSVIIQEGSSYSLHCVLTILIRDEPNGFCISQDRRK